MTTTALTGRELIDERRTADEFLMELEGELPHELEELLNDVNAKLEAKIEATARFVLSEEARAAAIREEETRLAARRKAIEARADFNKTVRLRALLDALGVEKVKGTFVTVALQNNPPALDIDESRFDEGTLRTLAVVSPSFVAHTPETFRLNRSALLTAYKAGHLLPTGCDVIVRRSVRIR